MDFRILRHELVDSTNELALREVGEGRARHGDVHWARGQTAGRGRRGAHWVSPPGEGLYASLVLAPPRPIEAVWLSMAAGLAVVAALEALGAADVQLKWPNDVLVRGAKISGLLIETRGFDARAPWYVVGVGINVGQREFPAELNAERAVTSLALSGVETDVQSVLEAFLARFRERWEQARFDPRRVGRDYLERARLLARKVEVELGERRVRGRLLGLLAASTQALLELEAGRVEHVPLEHVSALRAAPGPVGDAPAAVH